mmetsp:Transcript_4672/g.15492  ORF Transcript_4672/g.15492 Transcript_4672/m.15492 type:complete len:212 (+) Transcript_4672:549-1184(+)
MPALAGSRQEFLGGRSLCARRAFRGEQGLVQAPAEVTEGVPGGAGAVHEAQGPARVPGDPYGRVQGQAAQEGHTKSRGHARRPGQRGAAGWQARAPARGGWEHLHVNGRLFEEPRVRGRERRAQPGREVLPAGPHRPGPGQGHAEGPHVFDQAQNGEFCFFAKVQLLAHVGHRGLLGRGHHHGAVPGPQGPLEVLHGADVLVRGPWWGVNN